MPRVMNQFIFDITHNNKLYAVQQLIDFITKSSEGKDEIKEQSIARANQIMKSYGLTVHSIANRTTPAGKAFAQLAAEHCEQLIKK